MSERLSNELREEIRSFIEEKLPKRMVENHVENVVERAKWLCGFYPEADKEVVEAAAWLHDCVHPTGDEEVEEHNLASAKAAEEFLRGKIGRDKINKITECIRCHRSSAPPEPRSIEARIVASADNLAHFKGFELLKDHFSLERAMSKIERDLEQDFMLPEAREYAEEKMKEIKEKYY